MAPPGFPECEATRRALWVAFGVWVVALAIVSSLRGDQMPEMPFFSFDKVAHLGMFAAGGGLLLAALRATSEWGARRYFWTAAAVVAAIGVADEWRQQWTPGREGADVWDAMANVLGAVVGAAMLNLIYEFHRIRGGAASGRGAAPADRAP
jgi:VanZ family protein